MTFDKVVEHYQDQKVVIRSSHIEDSTGVEIFVDQFGNEFIEDQSNFEQNCFRCSGIVKKYCWQKYNIKSGAYLTYCDNCILVYSEYNKH